MALSGSLATTEYHVTSGYRTVILQWTATQNYATKETILEWQVVGGGTLKSLIIVTELRVTIDNDVEFYRAANIANRTECYIGTVLASGTKVLKHDSDGYRKVPMKIEAGIYQWAINCTGFWVFDLDRIPEASTIGAANADIESVATVIVTRETVSYTHSIKYSFGSLSGYLNADGTTTDQETQMSETSIPFKIPDAFYSQIPDAPSGTCTLECTTYMGSTLVGVRSTTFTASANRAVCAPIVRALVQDVASNTPELTGSVNRLIRYVSTARCVLVATAKNGASIASKKIFGVPVSGTTLDIPNVETGTFVFEATDSRGFTSTVTVTLPLVEYVKLSLNVQLKRTDATSGHAVLTIWGNYFQGSFGAVSNAHSVLYRVARSGDAFGDYIAADVLYDENTYSVSIPLSELHYESAYSAQVVVADSIDTLEKTAAVGRGIPIFDFGEQDFRFNVPLLFNEQSFGSTYPENPRKGQLFFAKNDGDGYTVRIFNGVAWL